jgi:hypothetical protein
MNPLIAARYESASHRAELDFAKRGFDIPAKKIFAATILYRNHIESLPPTETDRISPMVVRCVANGETRYSPAITFKNL